MTSMVGPMGFTDMDHEGMLVEGFDQMGTMATIESGVFFREQRIDLIHYQRRHIASVAAIMINTEMDKRPK